MIIVAIKANTPISISTKNTEERIARKKNIIIICSKERN
jgi:hypothetical protein